MKRFVEGEDRRQVTLLKNDIYRYLNRAPSGRRLERETQRNLELI